MAVRPRQGILLVAMLTMMAITSAPRQAHADHEAAMVGVYAMAIQAPFQIPTLISTGYYRNEPEQPTGWRVYNTITGGALVATGAYTTFSILTVDTDEAAAPFIGLGVLAMGLGGWELYHALRSAPPESPPQSTWDGDESAGVTIGVSAGLGEVSVVGRF